LYRIHGKVDDIVYNVFVFFI